MATPTLSSKSSIQSATKLGPAHSNRTLDVCALGQAIGAVIGMLLSMEADECVVVTDASGYSRH